MSDAKLKYTEYLNNTLPGVVLKSYRLFENEAIEIDQDRVCEVLRVLKEESGFQTLLDISSIDWQAHPKSGNYPSRFELDYFLYNFSTNERVQVKVFVKDNDNPEVESVTKVFPIAEWMERECYDMMGIGFANHPALKRLLMWEEFEGHPLRKDYPLDKRQPIPISLKVVE